MTSAPAAFAAGAAAGAAAAAWVAGRGRRRTGRMLSFVSHELNTPVTAINMTVLNFVSGTFGAMPKDQMEWMQMIRDQVVRLNCLVGELRDFIHIEFHRDFRLHLDAVAPAKMLETALAPAEGMITRTGARVALSVADGLPSVRADHDRVVRVLGSLLSHARKFRVDGPIQVSLSPWGAGVLYTVAYRGPRLNEREVAGMLDIYYPVSKTNTQLLASVGTGLGICRAIVEAHGGRMSLKCSEDGMTTVAIELPAGGPK